MVPKVYGPALLQLADQFTGKSKAELCRAAGYEAIDKQGKARPDYASLQNAMLAAHGHDFVSSTKPRSANYVLAVTKAGLLTIGKSYLTQLNAVEGTTFVVKIESDQIILTLDPDAVPSDAAGVGSSDADAALNDLAPLTTAAGSVSGITVASPAVAHTGSSSQGVARPAAPSLIAA